MAGLTYKVSLVFRQSWVPKIRIFNPIPAGVLENQDPLGGGQFDPPSKSHVYMTNDTSLESSCALLLESAKKIVNLRKLNFLSQNPVL